MCEHEADDGHPPPPSRRSAPRPDPGIRNTVRWSTGSPSCSRARTRRSAGSPAGIDVPGGVRTGRARAAAGATGTRGTCRPCRCRSRPRASPSGASACTRSNQGGSDRLRHFSAYDTPGGAPNCARSASARSSPDQRLGSATAPTMRTDTIAAPLGERRTRDRRKHRRDRRGERDRGRLRQQIRIGAEDSRGQRAAEGYLRLKCTKWSDQVVGISCPLVDSAPSIGHSTCSCAGPLGQSDERGSGTSCAERSLVEGFSGRGSSCPKGIAQSDDTRRTDRHASTPRVGQTCVRGLAGRLLVIARDGRLIDVNPAGARILGAPPKSCASAGSRIRPARR